MAVRKLEVRAGGLRNIAGVLARAAINYTQSGAVVLYTAPVGYYCMIEQVVAVTGTAWDGSGATFKVGPAADDDGYLPAGNATASVYGSAGANDQGALLWNSTDKHQKKHVLTGGQTISATITPGTSATAGESVIYVLGTLVKIDAA